MALAHPDKEPRSPTERFNGWPELLPLAAWEDTLQTLHRWAQIVGKIRMVSTPWINHGWHVPLYLTGRGLTTGPVHHGARTFELVFDFLDQRFQMNTIDGGRDSFALEPMSVAVFYRRTLQSLHNLGIDVRIWPMPVELPGTVVRFDDDWEHAAYDPEPVVSFWRALLQAQRVFTKFRARFLGKVSPVHLFWGALDLAVTRFSGRQAPPHPGGAPNCADWVMREAYSHEVCSAGFFAGVGLGEAAFYSYAYPEPDGYRGWTVRPTAACFHEGLGEFILPYAAVRSAPNPDETLLDFLQSTYEAAAELARWNRAELEVDEATFPHA